MKAENYTLVHTEREVCQYVHVSTQKSKFLEKEGSPTKFYLLWLP